MTVAASEQLDLHVPGMLQVSLQVDRRVPEVAGRFSGTASKGLRQFIRVPRHPEPATTAAAGRLHCHGIPVTVGPGPRLVGRSHRSVRPRHRRDTGQGGDPPCLDLISHRLNRRGRWTDKH